MSGGHFALADHSHRVRDEIQKADDDRGVQAGEKRALHHIAEFELHGAAAGAGAGTHLVAGAGQLVQHELVVDADHRVQVLPVVGPSQRRNIRVAAQLRHLSGCREMRASTSSPSFGHH